MSVVMLSNENRQLFGEQVNDHIAKLNDLMGLACGQALDRTPVEKACFAGRLLEGSTRMLGLDEWCRTLEMFRELLERSLAAGRYWDEQVSQIVSETLETEETAVSEIVADDEEIFGLQTLSINIASRLWTRSQLVFTPILIPPYYWHWWWRW